jgi:hypothetical protein
MPIPAMQDNPETALYDSPRTSMLRAARTAGVLYLIVIASGLFAEVFVRQALSVPNDPMATARNIQSHELFFRWGFVADLVNFICGMPVILFFYFLFSQVHKRTITLALFFVIVANAAFAINILYQLHPLIILGDKEYLNIFKQDQLAALSSMALEFQSQGYAIGLVFFGVYCMIIGYLIFKTSFLPKILGILYALAGACYLINSFTMFLSRGFHNPLFPYILFPSFIGEASVCLWLIFGRLKHTIYEQIQ